MHTRSYTSEATKRLSELHIARDARDDAPDRKSAKRHARRNFNRADRKAIREALRDLRNSDWNED